MTIEYDRDTLVVEQNNFATKTVNAYICYELNTLKEILLTILHSKWLVWSDIVKVIDWVKLVYSGYATAFDRLDLLNFGNDSLVLIRVQF